MLERTLFDEDHIAFRETVAAYLKREMLPNAERWSEAGIVDRSAVEAAGRTGLLGTAVPESYGGGGVPDFRFNVVLNEECHRLGLNGPGMVFTLHNDVVMPYFLRLATEEQRQRWLPGLCSGELISAVAMTEPGAGSDLAGIQTTAVRDGDHYVVNGSKTFITNGLNADVIVTVVKTDPAARHSGISLLVVERGMPGFERGRNLAKVGLHAQDTAELSFTDVRVPVSNLLGTEGGGFGHLMTCLPQERLSIAVSAVAAARAAYEWTVDHVRERKMFGTTLSTFQNTKFVIAEIATEIDVAQAFVDRCILEHIEGRLDGPTAAKAKWWATELQKSVVDRCVQLFGGYGYMVEYPIGRAYTDARITTIFGGTTEVMKEIIGRSVLSAPA